MRVLLAVAMALLGACATYEPEPVDLAAHARAFAARLPDGGAVRAFVARLREREPGATLDARDGLDLREAHWVALVFDPELRAARREAIVAGAGAEHAGLWSDPQLGVDVSRILEDVAHPWLAGASLALALPLTGRPGLEQALADAEHGHALLAVRVAEARALDALDEAWARWSTAAMRAELVSELLERLEALAEIADRLAGAGEITAMAARAFRLEHAAREAELIGARADATALRLDLLRRMGLPPERELELVPAVALAPRHGAGDRIELRDGPGLAVARREHDVAERRLQLEMRGQWPELTFAPKFEEEDAQPRIGVGIGLTLPLWNGNARAIAEARAARDLAAERLRGAWERAVQDFARAHTALAAARERQALIEERLVPLAEQQVRDGRRLAELGQLDTLLLLDGVLRAHEAKASALDAALAVARGTVELNALFWPDPAAEVER